MNSTGPSGSSSIGFSTGSVVVPAKSRDDGDLLPRDGVEQAATCRRCGGRRGRCAGACPCGVSLQAPSLASRRRGRAAAGVPRRQTASAREQFVELRGGEQAVGDDDARGSSRPLALRRARPARRRPRSRAPAPARWPRRVEASHVRAAALLVGLDALDAVPAQDLAAAAPAGRGSRAGSRRSSGRNGLSSRLPRPRPRRWPGS